MSRGMSPPSQWRNHAVGDPRSSVRPTPTWSIQRKKARVKNVKPLKKKHSVICALKGVPPRIRLHPLLRVEKPLRRLKLTWSLSAGKSIPRQAERIPAGNYALASVLCRHRSISVMSHGSHQHTKRSWKIRGQNDPLFSVWCHLVLGCYTIQLQLTFKNRIADGERRQHGHAVTSKTTEELYLL